MSEPKILTATTIAWLPYYAGPDGLNGEASAAIDTLAFSSNESMGTGTDPWTRVGTAEITVTLIDPLQMVENKVASLRSQRTAVLAEAQAKATSIDSKINELLVIDWDKPLPSFQPAPLDDTGIPF